MSFSSHAARLIPGAKKIACHSDISAPAPALYVPWLAEHDVSQNLPTILLRGRDRGSCAAQNAHVLKYIPLLALRFCYPDPADARSLQIVNTFLGLVSNCH